MYGAYHSRRNMSIGYIKIMTYCKIFKTTYVTHKTILFWYVVRVYPIETKEGGGGGVRSVRGRFTHLRRSLLSCKMLSLDFTHRAFENFPNYEPILYDYCVFSGYSVTFRCCSGIITDCRRWCGGICQAWGGGGVCQDGSPILSKSKNLCKGTLNAFWTHLMFGVYQYHKVSKDDYRAL